jgi:mannosyltransferase OCH1-like enzyme
MQLQARSGHHVKTPSCSSETRPLSNHSAYPQTMKDYSTSRNSSLRVFFARQILQLIALCIICGVLFVSFHTFTKQAPQLLLQSDEFPKKIWQSWKVDPTRFEHRDNERARTWTVKNPGHRYEVLTDDNADNYVTHHYGPLGLNRPDIVHVYQSLNAKIIKSDLLRYLIMYVEGGVYADIDVEAIRPIKKFIPKAFNEADVDMVIGIEVDEPDFASHPVLGSKAQSFCQWTFMCKPRLPVMLRLIEHIMVWLHELSLKQGKPISELYLDFNEVLSGTGPSAFTAAILEEMSKTVGEPVLWDRFSGLTEGKLVGGVLVLTVEAFAAGTGHSDSGNHGGKGAMVKHHFHASSWPTNHPRFKHPVYGEVEKCNWNMECVKLWDANTAFFDALPEDERLKIIGIKETKDAKKAELAVSPPMGAADQILLGPIAIPAEYGSSQAESLLDPMAGMPEQLGGEPALEIGGGQVASEPTPSSEQLDLNSQEEQWMDQSTDSVNAQSEEPMGESSPELVHVSGSGDHSATVDDPIAQVLEARGAEPEAAPVEEGLTPGLAL